MSDDPTPGGSLGTPAEQPPPPRKMPVGTPWQPGQSGNPSGRPRLIGRVRDLARANTAQAIATLVEIMSDREANPSARVAAASEILDRGWGRAPQKYDVEISTWDGLTPQAREAIELLCQLVADRTATPTIDAEAQDVVPAAVSPETESQTDG